MRSVRSQRGTSTNERDAARLRRFACLLAAGWLLVPSVQYLGTLQRTSLLLHGETSLPLLVDLDLSPLYVLLLLSSIACAMLARSRPSEP